MCWTLWLIKPEFAENAWRSEEKEVGRRTHVQGAVRNLAKAAGMTAAVAHGHCTRLHWERSMQSNKTFLLTRTHIYHVSYCFFVVVFFKSNSLSVSSNPSEAFQTQIYMSYHVWFHVSWHKYSLLLKLIHLTKQQTDLISPMMLHAWPQIVLQKGNLIFITITYVQGLW